MCGNLQLIFLVKFDFIVDYGFHCLFQFPPKKIIEQPLPTLALNMKSTVSIEKLSHHYFLMVELINILNSYGFRKFQKNGEFQIQTQEELLLFLFYGCIMKVIGHQIFIHRYQVELNIYHQLWLFKKHQSQAYRGD